MENDTQIQAAIGVLKSAHCKSCSSMLKADHARDIVLEHLKEVKKDSGSKILGFHFYEGFVTVCPERQIKTSGTAQWLGLKKEQIELVNYGQISF